MNRRVRLGAVNYLNVRPLVYGLERDASRVSLRFDPPSVCARLLEAGDIDLGMVPSITYLQRPGDRIVPGVGIASEGAVESVAIFTRVPIREVRTLAVDTSSRTSVALTRILCARRFEIAPSIVPHAPALASMLAVADAALVIGDAALFVDHRALGADKIDLGEAWHAMTGWPFVWAFWSGRADAASPAVVSLLHGAAEAGLANLEAIANAYSSEPERQAVGRAYLRDRLLFRLTDAALEGLRAYYREAVALGLADGDRPLDFFAASPAVRTA
jgi:chorismate dehydratase